MNRMLKKVINFSIAVMVFFIVLELCARVDDYIKYDAPFYGEYSHNILHSYDTDGIRFNIPFGHFEKWQNNKFGFRSPEFPQEKPVGATRVICMGASESYGLYESPGNEWPAQLSELLGSNGSYHVINTSTVGLPVDQYSDYLDKYVYQFEPDVAIILINPLGYMVRLERLAKRAIKSQTSPKKRVSPQKPPSRGFISSLRVVPKTKQMIKRFLPEKLLKKYQVWDLKKKILMSEERFLKGEKPFDIIPEESIDRFKTDLENIVASLKSREIEVILANSPTLFTDSAEVKYPIIFNEGRRFGVELSLKGMLDALHQADSVKQLVAFENEVGYIDLDIIVPNSTEYYADMVHLTDIGAELVAQKIAQYIKANTDN